MKTYKLSGKFTGTIDELFVDSNNNDGCDYSANRTEYGGATVGYEGNATGGDYSANRTYNGDATGGHCSANITKLGDAIGGDDSVNIDFSGNAKGGNNSLCMGRSVEVGKNSVGAIINDDGEIVKVVIRSTKKIEIFYE